MIRHRSKKDVDAYVLKIEESLPSEYQKNLKAFEIAKMYMEVGAMETARDYVGRYLSVRESSAVAHKLKGQVMESLGNKEKALLSLKRAYELDPSVSEVLLSIARLQSICVPFDVEEARLWLCKAQRVSPNNAAVGKLSDTVLYHENQMNGSHAEEDPAERSISIPSNFFSTPKAASAAGRRFPPRPSPERISAQFKSLESKQEGTMAHLDDRLDKLEEKNESLSRLLNEILSEVRQGKTISQNVATEMTLLKKDLKDRDELRMKDVTAAVAATTAAITSLHQQQKLLPKEPEEDASLLRQRLKEAEKQAAVQQAAFLQFAGAGYAALGTTPRPQMPPPPPLLRPDMFPKIPQQQHWPAEMPPQFAPIRNPTTVPQQPPLNGGPPSNIVISSSDKIPVAGKDVPTFSGSVTIPPEHRLGVRPSHSFQINIPSTPLSAPPQEAVSPLLKKELEVSPLLKKDAPPLNVTSSILSSIPDPVYSAVDGSTRQRQVSVNSNYTDDEEHDPCPDFKPIIPLPEEVDVITGEEEEHCLFEDRSKLYRFVDKEWKERGLGTLKILEHKNSGKVRVIMRREQTHKICANHHVMPDIKIEKMKNQDKAVTWSANDFSDEEVRLENFSARFKTSDQADKFLEAFLKAQKELATASPSKKKEEASCRGKAAPSSEPMSSAFKPKPGSWECSACYTRNDADKISCSACQAAQPGKEPVTAEVKTPSISFGAGGGFSFKATPPATSNKTSEAESSSKPSPFSSFSFGVSSTTTPPSSSGFTFGTPKAATITTESSGSKVEPFSFGKILGETPPVANSFMTPPKAAAAAGTAEDSTKNNDSYAEEDPEHDPCPDFKPIIPLPKEVEVVTGEEDEEILFEKRSKLFRFVEKEWKERGIGQLKILKHRSSGKVRLLMRRDQTLKVCANHVLVPEIVVERMNKKDNAVIWAANDFSDEEVKLEKFCAQFKTAEFATEFIKAFDDNKAGGVTSSPTKAVISIEPKVVESLGSMDKFKPKTGSWECPGCMCRNEAETIKCPACETVQPGKEAPKSEEKPPPVLFGSVGKSGFTFGGVTSPAPSTGFVFGNNKTPSVAPATSTPSDKTPSSYEPLPDVENEVELSFKDQSLKLNTAQDAKEVAMKISACKTMHILTLSGNTVGIEAAEALGKSLKKHPEFRRAHWKDMFTGRMKTEIPPALKHLSSGIMAAGAQLVELDLSDNAFGPIGMEGIKELLTSRACYSLKELRLNNTGCGVTGGEHLSELLLSCLDSSTKAGYPLALKVFVLGRSRQENKGAIALSRVFKRMKSLEEVSMPQNGIYHEGIAALMDSFSSNPGLRILNMNDNTFTVKGAESLAQALPNMPNLEVLNIGDCLLKTEGAIKVAKALKGGHQCLKKLHMDSNEILEEGGLSIVDAVADKEKLESLFIDGNQFGPEGCSFILDKLSLVGKRYLVSEFEDDQEPDDDESDEEESGSNGGGDDTVQSVGDEPPKSEIFGGKSNIFSGLNGSPNLFGAPKTPAESTSNNNIFGSNVFGGPVFGSAEKKSDATPSLGAGDAKNTSVFSFGTPKTTTAAADSNGLFSTTSNLPSFASISDKNNSIFSFGKQDEAFSFEGTGTAVFGRSSSKAAAGGDTSKTEEHDESEHDPYFEPIIPLPELVEVSTGEEEEKVLFSHRSKVYRYDSGTKEWKERGVGDIKILHHESRNTFRVLLRRDQILKIACNHLITEDMCLKPLSTSTTALCWFAMDFSEEESKLEQLAVKFKEASTCDKFKAIFEDCQAKLGGTQEVEEEATNNGQEEVKKSAASDEEYSDDGEYNDEYDYEEDSVVFSAKCTLSEEYEEGSGDKNWGAVELRVVVVEGFFKITGRQQDNDLVFSHFILDDTKIRVNKNTCSWSAYEEDDESTLRSFQATFEESSAACLFEDILFDGRDRAFQHDFK